MKIKNKFSLLLSLFGLLLLALLLFVSAQGRKLLEGEYLINFEREAILLLSLIERNMYERYHDVRVFPLSLTSIQGKSPDILKVPDDFDKTLNAFVANYQVYRRIVVLDTQGNLRGSNTRDAKGNALPPAVIDTAKLAASKWFQDVIAGRYLTNDANADVVVVGPGRNLLADKSVDKSRFEMVFAVPLRNRRGEVTGVWINCVDFAAVESIVSAFYRLLSEKGYYGGELTIMDSRGNILVDMDPLGKLEASYRRDFEVLERLNLVSNNVVAAKLAISGVSGSNISHNSRKNIDQVTGFAHSEGFGDYAGLGWSAMVRVPVVDVFKGADDLQQRILVQALVLLALVLTAGLWLSRRISIPLQRSTAILNRLAAGDVAINIPVHRGEDEIADINSALEYFRNSLLEKEKLQHQTEEQKRQLLLRNRAIDATKTGILICDAIEKDRPIIYVNKAFEVLTGYSAHEALGRNCRFLQGEQTDPVELDRLRKAIEGGRSCNVILANYRKDGERFFNNLRIDPVYDDLGRLTHFIGVQSDITELKKSQESAKLELERTIESRTRASKDTENRLRAIFNTSIDGMIVFDSNGFIQEANRSAELILGRSRENLTGLRFDVLLADEDSFGRENLLDCENPEDGYKELAMRREVSFKHRSGRHFPAEMAVGSVVLGDSQLYVAIIRDITEVKASQQTEQKLRGELIEREQIYRAAFNQAAVGIARVSTEGLCLEVNDKLSEIVGYSQEELLRTDLLQMVEEEDRNKDLELVAQLLGEQIKNFHIEKRYNKKDGEVVWINQSVSLVHDKLNQPKYFIYIIEDISERKRFERDLESARNLQLEHIRGKELASEAGGICFWSWTIKSNNLVWDDKMYEIYGVVPGGKLTLSVWRDAVHPRDLKKTEESLAQALAAKTPWSEEYRILHGQTGQTRWIRTAADIVTDQNGVPVKMFGINFDITEERLIQQALEKEKHSAQEASEAKSRFLAMMSHEIRTPMNSVVGMIDLLRETQLTSDQHRMARTIRDAAFSLLDIINDILDFSKIEAGQMALELIPTDINVLLEKCAEALWIHAAKLNVRLYIRPDLDLPGQFKVDGVRLRQIVLNLLGNAIKFTQGLDRDGEVVLSSKLVERKDGTCKIAISVEDNGIGMTQSQLTKLFKPFTQVDTSTTRRYGGTGLGLSITKALVDMMKGEIEVDSRFGFGSKFTVVLSCPGGVWSPAEITDVDLRGLNVLICVSDEKLTGIIGDILTHFECDSVALCANDEQAQTKAERLGDCDLIIVDKPDDLEKIAAEHKKHCRGDKELRFLVLNSDPASHKGVSGNNRFVIGTHPFKPGELIVGCAVLAGRESPVIEKIMLESLCENKVVAQKPASGDKEHLILVAEDQPTNREVIERQLNRLGYRCEIAHDGLEALEMWHTGRFALLLTDCHMPNLDGYELSSRIRQIEADDPSLRRTPIIAITANALAGESEHCLEAGMDDYLSKPVDLNHLDSVLGSWLSEGDTVDDNESKEHTEEQPTTSEEAEVSEAAEEPISLARLAAILGMDDEETLGAVLGAYWKSVGVDFPIIEKAIEDNDGGRLREAAHAAKGAARSSGAEPLADSLQRLENAAKNMQWQDIGGIMQAIRDQLEQIQAFLCARGIIVK